MEPGDGGSRGGPDGKGFFAPVEANSPTGMRSGFPIGLTIGLSTVLRPSFSGLR